MAVTLKAPTRRRSALNVGLLERRPRTMVAVGQLLVAAALIAGWQLSSNAGLVNPVFYSSPWRIVTMLFDQLVLLRTVYGLTIYEQIWVTLEEVLIGYAIGAAAGILLGFGVGRSRLLSRALEPYVLTFYAVPKISIAPLFVIILGLGLVSKIAIVLIEAFFILFYNTLRGVLQIDESLVQAAKLMGARRRTVLWRILFPASVPSIGSGLQLAVPFAVVGAVIGEYVSSSRGLGWLVLYAGSVLDATQLFVAIALLVVMTWVLTGLVQAGVRRLTPWSVPRPPRVDQARTGRKP